MYIGRINGYLLLLALDMGLCRWKYVCVSESVCTGDFWGCVGCVRGSAFKHDWVVLGLVKVSVGCRL